MIEEKNRQQSEKETEIGEKIIVKDLAELLKKKRK